jgi:hypothetical protein
MSSKATLKADAILVAFSQPRLQKLADIYNIDIAQAVLVHELLTELNGSIFASLSILEIHLRNMLDHQLSEMYGDNWLTSGPFSSGDLKGAVSSAKNRAHRNAYGKLKNPQRKALRVGLTGKRNTILKNAAAKVPVAKADIISNFYFSFWRMLFLKTYEPSLWNFGLRKVFPNKSVSRGVISDHLETILKVRNRIAHHELVHPTLCDSYIDSLTYLTKQLWKRGVVRKAGLYTYQAPYLKQIEYHKIRLQHILAHSKAK